MKKLLIVITCLVISLICYKITKSRYESVKKLQAKNNFETNPTEIGYLVGPTSIIGLRLC